MGSLEGRLAVVTGASRGMGRHFARALVAEGVRVALFARASNKLDEAAAEFGGSAIPVECDVSNPDSVRSAFQIVEEKFGGLDILVNNAGVSLLSKIEQVTDENVHAEVGINLMGPIFTCRSAIPMLRRSAHADIINVSSESARMPWPFLSIYAATKAGLESFTAGMRAEVREDLIRVTAIRAGYVTGGELGRNWSADAAAEWNRIISRSGHAQMAGTGGVSPEAMAEALIAILRLPREIDVDLIELRPTAP